MDEKSPTFLESLGGQQLSSIEFVQDYAQLRFDGSTLTLFVWPVIVLDKQEVHFGDPNYRDALCSRIGHNVTRVTIVEDEEIALQFDDGIVITVSLRPEDSTGPETGYLNISSDPLGRLLDF